MRLIDADELKTILSIRRTIETIQHAVDNAPTIDAVPRKDYEELERHFVNWEPVVRCKDCKHYAFTDNRVPQERVWWCYYWGYEIGADDYCSNGERKDDDKSCDTCKNYDNGWDDAICDGCTKAHSNWERRDDE